MSTSPRYLIISGIDGSGKTTIIQALRDQLENRGYTCHYAWMRYNHFFVKPLHIVARIVGLTKKYQTPVGALWKHEFYRFPLLAKIYIPLTWLDTWIGLKKLKRTVSKKKCDIVICDRWVNDVLIDLAVDFNESHILSNEWSVKFRKLIPSNSHSYVITRDRDLILDVRPESGYDRYFDMRYDLYQALPFQVARVENNKSIGEVVSYILDASDIV